MAAATVGKKIHLERVQLYDRAKMNLIWSNREKLFDTRDKSQQALLKILYDGRMKGQLGGKRVVTYRLSTSTPGKLGYGRYYGGDGSLETLEQDMRATLCSELYLDLDIVNAHPTIIIQYAKRHFNLDMPYIQSYVDDRSGFFKRMYDEYDLEESVVKNVIFIILYNGAIIVKHRDSVDFVKANNIPPEMKGMKKEMRELYTCVRQRGDHPDLHAHFVRLDKNVQGSFMSLVIQTEERKCLEAMVGYIDSTDLQVDVLAYDGCMIRGKDSVTDDVIESIEMAILEGTGYHIKLKAKPMIPITFEEAPASVYEGMKRKWEANHFYFRTTNTIVETSPRGIKHFGLEHAMEAFNGWVLNDADGKAPFLKKWRADPSRRMVDYLVYKRVEDCEPNEATLFTGFAFEQFPEPTEEERAEAVALFTDITLANAGDCPVIAEYLKKTYADMLQNPFSKSRTCIILSSKVHGVGKDTGLGTIERIIGNHTAHYIDGNDFWGIHDTKKEGAIMMYLEEACGLSNKANAAALKGRITSDTVTINPKGQAGYIIPNIARYFMTTNETDPVAMENTDRRYMIANPSVRLLRADWTDINDKLRRPAWMRAIAEDLLSMDLTDWKPTPVPVTERKADLMELSKTSEVRFLEQWVCEEENGVLGKDLYRIYREFCVENEIPYAHTARSFCIKILPERGVLFTAEIRGKNNRFYKSMPR